MKGQNTLQLNEATLIDALQEYIDKRMGSYAPKVTAVKMESGGGYSKTFEVKTDDKPALVTTDVTVQGETALASLPYGPRAA